MNISTQFSRFKAQWPSPFRRRRSGERIRTARGQSLVESALILPILIILLAVVLEGGFALNAWLRVQTAARDATRFALDAGRPAEITSLVLEKLVWMDEDQINVYLVRGTTNASGNIPNGNPFWVENHLWGGRPTDATTTRQAIEARIRQGGATHNGDVPFVIVEVDYVYVPTFLRVLTGNARIPMTSYAIMHQY